jgi:hypothetical protein
MTNAVYRTEAKMPLPVIVTIPHRLGKEEARRRLQAGLSNVHAQVSHSLVMLKDAWVGDHMEFQARLLGQSTNGSVDVAEDHVRLEVQLPWVLAMVANKAKALVTRQGQLTLEKPTTKR